ncbi:hypothetical protein BK009_03405 [Methanobacterium subterraneum]|uniref:Uncharacterized protein n=1 Tax=Methanobacterium subterraneum TaxID=59277 RepID=A0A2H4VNX0_9EURY|nr:hypothetical protein [Methanobacterium subterraneum]AUB59805.1 hypothetical protein BK009_03405 [Methanobacterium subterraneum]
MILIKQSYLNIEDLLSPADAKIYQKITDFYTDEDILYVYLINRFVNLKIKDRNSGTSLPFIDVTESIPAKYVQDETIVIAVNLDPLNRFPSVKETVEGEKQDLHHVQIEIEYIDPCPFFEKRWDLNIQTRILEKWDSFRNKNSIITCKDYQVSPISLWRRPGYQSRVIAEGPTQPVFNVIVPRGMRLINDFTSTKLGILTLEDENKLKIGKPHVVRMDGKESYNIVLNKKSYTNILNDLNEESVELELSYKVVNKHKFYLIPLFGFLLLFIGYEGFNFVKNSNSGTVNLIFSFLFTYLILQVSYLTLYLSLRRENYEIPFNSIIIPSIIFSVFLLIASFFCMP